MLYVSIGYMEQVCNAFFVNIDDKGGKSLLLSYMCDFEC